MNIYHLLRVCHKHRRRYPRFEVYTEQVIIASSLEKAEEGMLKHIENRRIIDNIYAFYIREIPVDEPAVGEQCHSERMYDASGQLLDQRLFSSIPEERELFPGWLHVPAKYDKIVVSSEEYVKVLFNGTWGWLDSDGKFTTDESRAAIGNWENYEK